MKKRSVLLRVTTLLALQPFSMPVHAEVTVHNAWVRATVGSDRPTAGYAEIENSGPGDDQLISVSTPISPMAELHRTTNEGGIMKMEPVGPLAIAAGQSAKLAPGGIHIMIMDVTKSLKAGDAVEMTFTFKTQGAVKVVAKVAPLAAQKMP